MMQKPHTAPQDSINLTKYPASTPSGQSELQAAAPTPAADEPPRPSVRVVAFKLLSATFAFFIAGINDGSLGTLIPYILRAYQIHTGQIAILYTSGFVGWLLAALLGGYPKLHLGTGGTLVLGAALQIVAYTLRFWKPPFGLFCTTFFFAALRTAFQDSQANTFVSTVKTAHRWLGVIHASYGVGCLVGPLIAAAIAPSSPDHWTWFYFFPLGLSVANLFLVAASFRNEVRLPRLLSRKPEEIGEVNPRKAWPEMKLTLRNKTVWLLGVFFFFHLGAAITAGGWLVEYLVTVRKNKLSEVGYVPSGMYGGLAVGRLLLAEPTFRLGERRMLLIYSALCLVLQIVFWKVKNLISSAITVSLMGFFLGPFFATGISTATKILPVEIHATALGT
ncbi:MFS general substrate transporter [Mytilinidion resinicola]|uniref:MFS general substrate transporter n=1 Tax=Mytilinidion resinicola TaxID=574789 RepID=A0A6A6YT16_9PEZI|nr:MFS general substrate transporter [Mytilinidion resinicola]KAF2811911.1 MFS general substrate transporter [Mytilinidion resinicola]